jgi:hypothetical protein
MAEVAVPEPDVSLVRAGEPVAVKLNAYPTRLFHGTVVRPGSHVGEEGNDRFVVAEVRLENAPTVVKTGMMGRAKISTVKVSLLTAALRKPARWIWSRIWPLLP